MRTVTITNTSRTVMTVTDGIDTYTFKKNTASLKLEGDVVRMKFTEGIRPRDFHFKHSQVDAPVTDDGVELAALLQKWIDGVQMLHILATQTAGNDPVIVEELVNDLGDYDFERDSAGSYDVIMDGSTPFTSKTTVSFGAKNSTNATATLNGSVATNDTINISTLDDTETPADGLLTNTLIKIEVYN